MLHRSPAEAIVSPPPILLSVNTISSLMFTLAENPFDRPYQPPVNVRIVGFYIVRDAALSRPDALYAPNLFIIDQAALHGHVRVPIVAAPAMYFIGTALPASLSLKRQFSDSNASQIGHALCDARQEAC